MAKQNSSTYTMFPYRGPGGDERKLFVSRDYGETNVIIEKTVYGKRDGYVADGYVALADAAARNLLERLQKGTGFDMYRISGGTIQLSEEEQGFVFRGLTSVYAGKK